MPLKRRNRAQVEFSMASMTDLIFLLLIFFMITASFVTPNAIPLTLPKAEAKVVSDPVVTVSIDKNLDIFVNQEKMSLDRLPSALQAELSGKAQQVIMISADKSVPIDNVVQVMVIGKQLNAKTILATQSQQ